MKPRFKPMTRFLNIFLKGFVGITLAPFGIYLRPSHFYSNRVRNHETIHWAQQMEMLILPFYFWYVLEWFLRLFINGPSRAYENLSFEREASAHEGECLYLSNRKPFSWFKYLINKANTSKFI